MLETCMQTLHADQLSIPGHLANFPDSTSPAIFYMVICFKQNFSMKVIMYVLYIYIAWFQQGMGEGEGAKDVSDQIENEDQLLGAEPQNPEKGKVYPVVYLSESHCPAKIVHKE